MQAIRHISYYLLCKISLLECAVTKYSRYTSKAKLPFL